MKYFVDFDGTIVDVWARYFEVFCACAMVPSESVDFQEYRRCKLRLHRDRQVAAALGIRCSDDESNWTVRKRKLLESDDMLALDQLLAEPDALLAWFGERNARILTKRRDPIMFNRQLKALGLNSLSDDAVVLNPDTSAGKMEWILEHESGPVTMIGDSPEDMRVFRRPRSRALFVDTGLWTWNDICSRGLDCENVQSLANLIDGGNHGVS